MKYKYALFEFHPNDSSGGMGDLILKFNSYEEVEKNYKCKLYDSGLTKQLLYIHDMSYAEFDTEIDYRIGKDNKEEIIEKRKTEFLLWLKEQISKKA